MTTGSRGLHVVVPLNAREDFDDVRGFAKDVADVLAAAHPDRLTTAARKEARGDRLYLDVQRNGYAQTAVAPFSVRAAPGAPVAVPLTWEQLDDPVVHARHWTIDNALEQARSDPGPGSRARDAPSGPPAGSWMPCAAEGRRGPGPQVYGSRLAKALRVIRRGRWTWPIRRVRRQTAMHQAKSRPGRPIRRRHGPGGPR
ncbi:hypothetical protein SALBM135S_06342 [Streptomyces alboniger]